MSVRAQRFYLVPLLLLPFAVLMGCDESVTGLDLPEADPEAVLFVDDFDGENGGEGENNWVGFQNFDVLDGCVDLHGNDFHDVQPGNGLYVDMDGTCEEAGTIESKEEFQFLPNEKYLFEVWLAGNNREHERDTMDVTLGSVYSEQFTLRSDNDFELYTRELSVSDTTEAKLKFDHYGGDDRGILVDLIRIRRAE